MKTRILFIIAIIGIATGVISVIVYNQKIPTQPPITVSYNPYTAGIYATGIVESYQENGSNVNIFPEVSSRITNILVKDGAVVKKDTPLMTLDDSVQRGIVEKDAAQISYAQANLLNVQEQLDKIQKSYDLNPKSISLNTLDNAINAVEIAKESVKVAQGQYDSDKALLDKYVIYAPIDGVVLRIVPAIGDYTAVAIGSYDPYTQGFLPAIQMGVETQHLQVRAYIDEILVPQLPASTKLEATMFIRGLQNHGIALEFSNIQPYTIPNIELSDQRNERVDVRVLPIIFKFERPSDINVFPGQLVDVYIKGKP
ncbi:MAG: efflux RND transporter periplasmic adaptor subunit [Gammaproteobacteria bacterium]